MAAHAVNGSACCGCICASVSNIPTPNNSASQEILSSSLGVASMQGPTLVLSRRRARCLVEKCLPGQDPPRNYQAGSCLVLGPTWMTRDRGVLCQHARQEQQRPLQQHEDPAGDVCGHDRVSRVDHDFAEEVGVTRIGKHAVGDQARLQPQRKGLLQVGADHRHHAERVQANAECQDDIECSTWRERKSHGNPQIQTP